MFGKFISKASKNGARIQDYKNEHSGSYMILFAMKIVISLASIATSFIFMRNEIYEVIPFSIVAVFLAVLILGCIEAGSFITSEYSAKYLFRRHWINFAIYAPIAFVAFWCSFQLSANGLAEMGKENADNSKKIELNINDENESINSTYDKRIAKIESSISLIVPYRWNKGNFTSKQQSKIVELNEKIDGLEAERTKELKEIKAEKKDLLSENETKKNSKGSLFFWIAGGAIIAQLIFSLIMGYYQTNVYFIDNTKGYIKENVTAMKERLTQQATNEILSTAEEVTTAVVTDYSISRELTSGEESENPKYRTAARHNTALTGVNGQQQNNAKNGALMGNNGGNNGGNSPVVVGGFGNQQQAATEDNNNDNNQQQPPTNNITQTANFYWNERPDLCNDIVARYQKQLNATTGYLAQKYNCSESTVRNCQRAIIVQ